MKKLLSRTVIAVFAFTVIFTFSSVSESLSVESATERLDQDITMQNATSIRDPYTLMFNINLSAPGRISVHIRKPEGSFHLDKNEKLFRIIIVDARGYHSGSRFLDKKYIRKSVCFKHERGLVEYSVDSLELDSSKGNFMIFIANFYKKRPYQAHVQLMYPVVKSTELKLKPLEMKLRPMEIKGFSGENMEE
ncbi:MAG: hypothetical protein CVV44_10835 [Spirochaetae bacterium HGW-Spirochaetae-1]|jgi:hypothetical protein|nr:MAG: hypothetical protein CVV44_10835 [Spirochaetae bacterium HGW-Spirochaetae-1]